MSGTILEYLKEYGDCTFETLPMNDVDSLILCQLSYLKFDGMVPDVKENLPSVTLEQIIQRQDYEKLFADERFEKDNRALVEGMLSGRRYRSLRLNCYINIIEKEWETQFAAVTFLLPDHTMYVAFRGTDETIVGWKEDFNMAYLSPVPGQAYSVKYLNMVTGKLRNSFYVGGHSKGGNLAVYSAMNCTPEVQERILKIYNMDGPGFRPEVLETCHYERIADRVVKILPHSSVVGMLFGGELRYYVVKSKSFGFVQHNPFNWKVEGADFVRAEDIYSSRRLKDRAVNEWMLSLDEEKRRAFVDTLYQVISASQADDLITFAADWKKSVNGMIGAVKELDEETVKMLRQVIKALFTISTNCLKEELGLNFPRVKPQKEESHRARRQKGAGERRRPEGNGQERDVQDAIEVPEQEESHE